MIDTSDYTLEPLQTDGGLILHRGVHPRPGDGEPPSVLIVAPAEEYASPATLARLEHEHALAAGLDPQWAVRPVALGRHHGRPVLVLDDPGGEPLDRQLGQPMEMGAFLRLAIGLARAVSGVHAAGLIHKDIKPANVLVHPATGHVWLTGFGIASRLPREQHSPLPPESIAGTLAYMAPEQTGRINRSIDSRADLYALGVTLYEMLTGRLPFTAADPMEWVHCHIARRPVPPAERVPAIPSPVSAVIMKLLAKTAEDRYQTAAGLERDLRHCLAEWEAQRRLDDFPLGRHDTPDRLLIPGQLYGREREVETLLAAFDRIVQGGRPELVLVSGHSGIGKSSVVNELHKMLVPSRGLFASGKFDQYKRDIPYSTLAHSFQSLIRGLLATSDADLASWRDALRAALGPNGALIVDLVPELQLVIGDQPPVPDLPAQQAQGRFQLVFRRFVGVFARPEHPLVLFLDDVQWLDAATLALLEDVLTQPDMRHVLLIGAYRDNEVTAAHPLMHTVEAIRHAGALVQEIRLASLAHDDLSRLIVDALRCEPERATPLAKLVHEKTGGNPFFIIQFLYALADEGLLAFDYENARWSWDLDRIHAKGYTENVVDLMVGTLHRLPRDTRSALQQLTCLGNAADITILSIVLGTSEAQVHADLWEAVRLGLVARVAGSYKFVHDRVQEAIYSTIPVEARAAMHLRIGRLLATRTPPEQREEAIFEIVNQLNRGAALITAREEQEQLADLNLIAGKRAKRSTAYGAALTYLSAAVALLSEDRWNRLYELAFALELHRAECEFLTGDLEAAEQRLGVLWERAASFADRAAVGCLRVDFYTALDQTGRAVAVALETLRHVGIEWRPHPSEDEARREYERIWTQLGSRTVEELVDLPLMTDPASLATIDVLVKMAGPAQYTDANLYLLVVSRAVNLSLERGNCDGSCLAYERLATVAGARFGDYKAGFSLGRLGYEIVERRDFKRFQARTYIVFGSLVMPWTRHVKSGRELVRRGFDTANQIGDLIYAAHGLAHLNKNMLAAGDPLSETQRQVENGLEFARKVRFGFVTDFIGVQLALVRTLRGSTPTFGCFDDGQFDERQFEGHLSAEAASHALPECYYWVQKLQARFLAGDVRTALDAASKAQPLLWTSLSQLEQADYHFYAALSRAAACDAAMADERQEHLEAVAAHHEQLRVWAENCPENFANRAALVGAELARLDGRPLMAMDLYEQAIRAARDNGFIHNEALAYELAARFYAARGFQQIADLYLRTARHGYLRWGAEGKVRQLDARHPHLGQDQPVPGPTRTIESPVEHLDLATVIEVSQAVSGEIELDRLLDTLMRTAIEHAGAERGLLILSRGSEPRIAADATTTGDTIVVRLRGDPVTASVLPHTILRYVLHTREPVILDDASAPNAFSGDEYIVQRRARSVLCLPLVKQGALVAVLYLENNLAPGVFTSARMAVLQLLASEAAMSLDNSRLYRELEEREARIRRLVDANIIGVVIADLEGPILEANDAYLQMLGYTRDDLAAARLRWPALTPPEWHAVTARGLEQIRTTGRSIPYEKELIRKDGTRVPALVGGAAFEESRTQAVFFVLDLTERRRAEEALQRAHTELTHVSRVTTLGELVASIAHEVNQPLAAIVADATASLNWLAGGHPDHERVRDALEAIVADGHRAADVIRRIRQLATKSAPLKARLDINGVIRDVVPLVRAELLRHQVSLRLELAPDLPPVAGDRVELQQVVLNLVINASEAMASLTDRPREVVIRSAPHGPGHVAASVQDTGVGIDPATADTLFNAFVTTKAGGMGMGLSISRSIIQAHGGRLWATSNEPHGAIFHFSLPVDRDAHDRP